MTVNIKEKVRQKEIAEATGLHFENVVRTTKNRHLFATVIVNFLEEKKIYFYIRAVFPTPYSSIRC